jgi:PIN domain nuclease of toxin-antitoxin system
VVDTSALIWFLTGSKQLSQRAKEIFEAAALGETRLVVSVISMAEMYYADQKWGLFKDFEQIFTLLDTRPEFRFAPLVARDVLDFDDDAGVPEMHDRIIVGLARRLGAPLIASDLEIQSAKIVPVEW